jgi:hypothetical protein
MNKNINVGKVECVGLVILVAVFILLLVIADFTVAIMLVLPVGIILELMILVCKANKASP